MGLDIAYDRNGPAGSSQLNGPGPRLPPGKRDVLPIICTCAIQRAQFEAPGYRSVLGPPVHWSCNLLCQATLGSDTCHTIVLLCLYVYPKESARNLRMKGGTTLNPQRTASSKWAR